MSDDGHFIGFNYVPYATWDTVATPSILLALGFKVRIYRQKIEKFNIAVTKMTSAMNEIAEIVEPFGPDSVVSTLLKNHGAGVYHVCYRTDDFKKAQSLLKRAGAITITEPMRIPYPI